MPRTLKLFLTAVAISAAFFVGIYFGGHYYRFSPFIGLLPTSLRSSLFPGDQLLQLEREVGQILEEGFYQPVDREKLENGALEGLVKSLDDPYTAYFSPEEFRRYQEHANGTFVGVGIILDAKDSQMTVVTPIENSPAKAAGIEAGDIIVAVNGEAIEGKTSEEVAAFIRGEEGSKVDLRIKRGEAVLDFSLVRRPVELPIVYEEMMDRGGKKIGYLRLEQFSRDAGAKLKTAMDKLVGEGAQGLILDLRNNGGGILDESVNVASLFIQNGPIVSVVSRDTHSQVYEARGDANEALSLIVLINGYTASASEIVAGAIKDGSRGRLVGEKTFGKGVVQNINPLSNGGALKYTSGSYFTPRGTDINKIGIEPDIPVSDDAATEADEALERGLALLAP